MSQKYVALLRGVNVGGNHRVPNADFRDVLEHLDFKDVRIYINSGNAIFTSEHEPVRENLQSELEKRFGFTIPTLVLSAESVRSIAAAIPVEWTNNTPRPDKSGQKSDVLYLFDEVNKPTILDTIEYDPAIETMKYVDGAVLSSISRANQTKSSLLRIVGTPLYRQVTIRNITTAKKLAELTYS